MAAMPAATLITVAPTGAESQKDDNPALPVTLDELVVAARSCQDAGAAMIHLHIRDDDGRPTLDLGRLRETVAAVRAETDLIVQLSTGGAVTDPFETRLAVLDAAPDSCSLTTGTVNFGDDVFANPWPFVAELYQRTQALGILPEFELFELGHVTAMNRLLDTYGAPSGGHVHADFVMGVPGGMPGTARRSSRAWRCCPPGRRGRPPGSAGPAFLSCSPRSPSAGTCGWAWRTPSPTVPSVPPGTTPSWSSAPPAWPPRRSVPLLTPPRRAGCSASRPRDRGRSPWKVRSCSPV